MGRFLFIVYLDYIGFIKFKRVDIFTNKIVINNKKMKIFLHIFFNIHYNFQENIAELIKFFNGKTTDITLQ